MKPYFDKHGWPIETFTNRPIGNRTRIAYQWLRGNWRGGRFGFRQAFTREYYPHGRGSLGDRRYTYRYDIEQSRPRGGVEL